MSNHDEAQQTIELARELYQQLPAAEFTRKTFQELGESAGSHVPWTGLSGPVKACILRLTVAYERATANSRIGEQMREDNARMRVEIDRLNGLLQKPPSPPPAPETSVSKPEATSTEA